MNLAKICSRSGVNDVLQLIKTVNLMLTEVFNELPRNKTIFSSSSSSFFSSQTFLLFSRRLYLEHYVQSSWQGVFLTKRTIIITTREREREGKKNVATVLVNVVQFILQ